MVGEDEEPELVSRADVEDAFEAQGSGGGVISREGLKWMAPQVAWPSV